MTVLLYLLTQNFKVVNYNSTFYIQVYKDGYQIPIMHLESNLVEGFKELAHLARGHMSKSKGVIEELGGIEKVLNSEKDTHSFGGDDWCIVDFGKEVSVISSGYDEFESFEIDSDIILKLLKDWNTFLMCYENGEIPGIIHPNKSKSVQ